MKICLIKKKSTIVQPSASLHCWADLAFYIFIERLNLIEIIVFLVLHVPSNQANSVKIFWSIVHINLAELMNIFSRLWNRLDTYLTL